MSTFDSRAKGLMTEKARWWIAPTTSAVLALLGLATYAHRIEPEAIRLERITLRLERARGLPAGGLRILHMSDLHLTADGPRQERKLRATRRLLADLEYDVVLLTGDLIHDNGGIEPLFGLVEELHPRLGAFACLGNHDYVYLSAMDYIWRHIRKTPSGVQALTAALRSTVRYAREVVENEMTRYPVHNNDVPLLVDGLAERGVVTLINRSARVQHADGTDLWFAGCDDFTEGKPNIWRAIQDVPDDAMLFLLAHNPDLASAVHARRADLIFSGHTHGGQIRLPLIGAAHTGTSRVGRNRAAGLFVLPVCMPDGKASPPARQARCNYLYISRGWGESIPLRFACGPEVALIHVAPACLQGEQAGARDYTVRLRSPTLG